MTLGGWINMILSVGAVTFLCGWTIYRVLSAKPGEHRVHGFDIDTGDEED